MSNTRIEDNRIILSEALGKIWNEGKEGLIEDYYHPYFQAHINGEMEEPARGWQGIRNVLMELRTAFPDFYESCRDLLCDGDKVVARLVISGTRARPYQDQGSNGR